MGLALIAKWKNLKSTYKLAFLSTMLIGLLVHFYKFTNTLLNHDSLYHFYTPQNMTASGRWFLSTACGISSYYDLPWVNGILSLFYIALTAVILVALFRIVNPIVILLTAGLLVTFPGTTETLFFNFTADGFFLAMLLAAFGAYLIRIKDTPTKWQECLLSAICLCLSCGIYQAYVSFALILSLCHLVYELLENRHSDKAYLHWIRRQVLTYSAAMIAYFLIWKLCLHVQGIVPNDYQGISQVASFHLDSPVQGLMNAVKFFILFFVQWNVLEHGFTLYSILHILFLIVMVLGILYAVIRTRLYKRKLHLVLFCLAAVALVPFSCIWCIISTTVNYRPMMLLCFVLLFILTAIVYDRWFKPKWSNLAGLLLTLIILHNGLLANISYYNMHLCNERTYAESVQLMTRINHYTSEYDIAQIAIMGNRRLDVQLLFWNEDTKSQTRNAATHILATGLETTLLFDEPHTMFYLQNIHGLDIPFDTETDYSQYPAVQSMECWPSESSFLVIDNTLIIKIGPTP